MRDADEIRKKVKEGKRYIEEHLYEKGLNADQLALVLGLSKSGLWRSFTEFGGYTVEQHIRIRRLQKAARNLRNGARIEDEADKCDYGTVSGFARAFESVYGITPWEFAKTKGKCLMPEPKITEHVPFYIVGYVFPGDDGFNPEDTGAYWITQDFPKVSSREYARIGGGSDMVATWSVRDGQQVYIMGAPVKRIQYIPKLMDSERIPGGSFAVFPVESTSDNTILCEDIRATWFFALHQWLPDSDYEVDDTRKSFEYYLAGSNAIYIPIVPKIRPQKRRGNKSKDK